MHSFKYLFLFLGLCLTVQCQSPEPSAQNSLPLPSLDHKIGQLLLSGFRDTVITEPSHIKRDILDYHLGGVIIYEYDVPSKSRPRNISSKGQIGKLCSDLQSLSTTPLFISSDEEGGKITRLKSKYGFPKTQSPQSIGSIDNTDSTYSWASEIAIQLKQLGINLNFAPLLDLNVNPTSPVIGNLERSFSAETETVKKHATLFIQAHKEQGILCAVKHFPGHGSAKTDSHEGFTDVSTTWTSQELIPYKEMVKEGTLDMVMTAHVYNNQLDTLPATLSKKIMQDILREEIGWKGVIISDDLQMGAIADHYDLETTIFKSLEAGVDILLISNNSAAPYDPDIVPTVHGLIKKMVKDGRISESQIDASYQKIKALKLSL